jgi:hypothetical protein
MSYGLRRSGRRTFHYVLIIIIATTTVTGAVSWQQLNRSTAPAIEFGVLGSKCATERMEKLHGSGVTLAQVDVRWDLLEPQEGVLNDAYAEDLEASIDTCRAAGVRVILGLGLQYAPTWVSELPDGQYLDQSGAPNPQQVPNLVFGKDVRAVFAKHSENVLKLVGSENIHAIRLGTSEAGELGYPVPSDPRQAKTTGYWAFNDAAQTGNGLPSGVHRSPLPGWKPGDDTWQGHDVTDRQVANWFTWYSNEAVQSVLWQVRTLENLGFKGQFHVPLAGRGALPKDLTSALASHLNGAGDRDGSLKRGLYYPTQLRALAQKSKSLRVDVTGLDDATAVMARALRPAQDLCTPMDSKVDLVSHPQVDQWSAARWTIANARRAGLEVLGENPGSPDAPGTGASSESDGLQAQMRYAPRYAAACGLKAFLWAFEDDLFGDPEELTLDDYRAAINVSPSFPTMPAAMAPPSVYAARRTGDI